jgi:phospholipase C
MVRFASVVMLLGACASPGTGAPPASGGHGGKTDGFPDADPFLAERQACQFGPGALAADTVGLDESARLALPIAHIVVLMKENRSFDHLLGGIAALQPDAEVFPPGFTNPDASGEPVAPFHLPSTCIGHDPGHGWNAMHAQVDDGFMDGYLTSAAASTGTDGRFAIGYYEKDDLPFTYFLASTYALADHYFPSVRGPTFPNRDYLLLGTSDGVTDTQYATWPSASLPSIFDRLDAAGVSWGVYADDHPLEETLNDPAHDWEALHPWRPVSALYDDFAADRVPSVVFVDGREDQDDEHPTADLQAGEAWTKRIYDAAVSSPSWSSTVLLLTYDEAGGFFDHVPPPDTCPARPEDAAFFELGTRVPLIVVSPWARRHFVAHGVKEHTSITRFIEAVYGLPALTARDANSDALLDMFDFTGAPAAVPAAPAAGHGGCRTTVALDATTYAVGQPIVATFGYGTGNATDWIGVYPRGVSPHTGSTIWEYVDGSQTAGAAVTDGTVVLGPGSGAWPLAAGAWTAYFLVDDGYTYLASFDFDVR